MYNVGYLSYNQYNVIVYHCNYLFGQFVLLYSCCSTVNSPQVSCISINPRPYNYMYCSIRQVQLYTYLVRYSYIIVRTVVHGIHTLKTGTIPVRLYICPCTKYRSEYHS